MNDSLQPAGTIPRLGLAVMILLGLLAAIAWQTLFAAPGPVGQLALIATLAYGFTEGGLALLVFVAAGGWGCLLTSRLLGKEAPAGLKVTTGVLAGLWLLSSAIMVVGSLVGGLSGYVWWPVIGVGLLLAAWQSRPALERWQPARRFESPSLMWIALAMAAGLWLAGATRAPGLVLAGGNAYDVLEYHLQVPREFYNAGQITALEHNVYSFYPLGLEMLYLLGMVLRGGPYEGALLAQLMHGMMGALAVASVFLALRTDRPAQSRFSALLLGTVPLAVGLAFLAMVELAQLAAMALAAVWLKQWIAGRSWRSALGIGIALGAACCFKYLSVGMIVAPVLAAMVVLAALARGRGLQGVLVAAVVTLVLLAPWLVRNTALTGNPVFPLATQTLGRAHWDQTSQQRWDDGHAPAHHPPVPVPPLYERPDKPGRAVLFARNFLSNQAMSHFGMMLAGAGICVMIALPRRTSPWEWAILGILVAQLALWTAVFREMPDRFLTPATVPLALLGGWGLSVIARVVHNPLRPGNERPGVPWGRMPAVGMVVATVIVNLLVAGGMLKAFTPRAVDGSLQLGNGVLPEQMSEASRLRDYQLPMPEEPRFLLIGEARAFYYPPGSLYATAFDEHPLEAMVERGLDAEQMLDELREAGITHVFVSWADLWRLSGTYGYPRELTAGLYESWQEAATQPAEEAARPRLAIIDKLVEAGLVEVTDLLTWTAEGQPVSQKFPAFLRWQAKSSTTAERLVAWPAATLYALPEHAPEDWQPPVLTPTPQTAPATQPATQPTPAN
jgi:hypothetical protein